MKKYAVVADISPSEQLSGNDDEVKVLALLFGLKSPLSFELVGNKFPDQAQQLNLRKWSGAKIRYKLKFIQHAIALAETYNVAFGAYLSNERAIRRIGSSIFQKINGPFPAPVSFNNKGKPRIAMGGYKVDGTAIPKYEVLQDDLIVLGWYAEALISCHKLLVNVNNEPVRLDVIIDKLPNEQGGVKHYKATLLRNMLRKDTKDLIDLVGVPEKSDNSQRDILVDNIAGLRREIEDGTIPIDGPAKSLYQINRKIMV